MKKAQINMILKSISLKSIIILVVLLAFNSYAWFIYATKVSGTIDVHVSSWNIDFKAGDEELGTNITFDVTKAYPGMDDYSKTLDVKNNGEVAASLKYKIKSVRVLDKTYEVSETTTSENLENMLKTNFPFVIEITTSSDNISAKDGSATFNIVMKWPIDSGDDAKDTDWGQKAYEYYKLNPDGSCIHIELEITAKQTL